MFNYSFSIYFERLIGNGKSSVNFRVFMGSLWSILLSSFHMTQEFFSAFVDMLTASLFSNLQETDHYCCKDSPSLRQGKIHM